MRQKFRRLTFVKVCKELPAFMWHFHSDFIGIVRGTYSQMYGGTDIGSYSLYVVDGDKVVNNISWYYESQLTELENQDREKAEEMIEEYIFSREIQKELT